MKIAILGGTGDEGLGLAIRFAGVGHAIIIGSRSIERAEAAAGQVQTAVPSGSVRGRPNADAAAEAELVLVSVPYAGLRDTVAAVAPHIDGKILVSLVCPLQFGKGGPHAMVVDEGSAAEQARAAAPSSRVVGAFHNLSAHELMEPELDLGCDVLVCSDDRDAKREVMALAEQLKGVRAVDGGGLAYSRYLENLTALLIGLNRRYKTQTGIRITHLPAPGGAV